jgi:hypothetical protein
LYPAYRGLTDEYCRLQHWVPGVSRGIESPTQYCLVRRRWAPAQLTVKWNFLFLQQLANVK